MSLADALRAHGGALADAVGGEAPEAPGPGRLAAMGPRAAGAAGEYELLLEIIREGSRLHYTRGRVIATEDRDLALLLGDQLYALGLSRLAALGDLDAVAELADVISLVAQAHAADDPELAEAVWEAGAVAIGWGATRAHEKAKGLAREGDPLAAAALRDAAAAARGRPS